MTKKSLISNSLHCGNADQLLLLHSVSLLLTRLSKDRRVTADLYGLGFHVSLADLDI